MSHFFCKSCGHHMASNSLFCDECGALTASEKISVQRFELPAQSGKVTLFFASQPMLCLFTLLVFLGLAIALAPAGWRYANLQTKAAANTGAASTDSRSLGGVNTASRCNQIVVIFNSTATVARVSALLEQLDTTIAFGPNENGAFELSTPVATAAGVSEALNRASDAVVSASLQRRCL